MIRLTFTNSKVLASFEQEEDSQAKPWRLLARLNTLHPLSLYRKNINLVIAL